MRWDHRWRHKEFVVPHPMTSGIHHVGLAVPDLDAACKFFSTPSIGHSLAGTSNIRQLSCRTEQLPRPSGGSPIPPESGGRSFAQATARKSCGFSPKPASSAAAKASTVRMAEFQNFIFARLSSDTEVAPGWPWALVW
jgi:hypothetical protein